ncbi:MAG: IS66 family transposase [Lachnospiraceae bacterium]|nr:IS66 family transposase [Lachnospiraceae bacterium]MDD7209390.1 IS66 family transposase [Lachnospiraceae bacterium]
MPVTITYEFVQQLMEQNALLLKQNENLTASVAELTDTVDKLKQTIEELREQLNKNSRNSSKPPSSDGLGKPTVKKDRSLREASGKKQGAQEGHEGVCLSIISNPDHTENHMHSDCEGCPYHDACLEKACIKETRHEIDAVVTVDVTAHNLFSVPECPLHGGSRTGHFPADIKAAVQYGKNLQAMVVAFNTVGAVSINRTHEILSSVFNIPLATGTIKNMVTRCADSLKGTHEKIRLKMTTRGLIHCDETGTRVDGKTWWVHNASDRDYTYLTINKKRGRIGMDEAGVLPHARGIIVHDCWGSYWQYPDVTHAICCAHLLRELNGVIENHPEQTWAPKFRRLLLDMKKSRDEAVQEHRDELSSQQLSKFDTEYDDIIKTAYEENPLPETSAKKRGRKKKSKVLNLICRLDNYKASVCLFIKNLCVPFDNNQAERDLRMVKVKTKVSGCFRSEEGAQEYLTIMSYIGCANKHHINAFTAIREALNGNPDIIFA